MLQFSSGKMQKSFLTFILVGFGLAVLTLVQESDQMATSSLTTKVRVSRAESVGATEMMMEPGRGRPMSTQWRACGAHLARKIQTLGVADRSFDKLLKTFHVSDDATLSLVRHGSLKKLNVRSARHLISTSRDIRDKFQQFARTAHVQHKWIELGSKVLVLYPDNTVVTADSQSCSVRSVHLSFGNNELHPEIRDDVLGNNLLVRSDKKKKVPPPPPPKPRARPYGYSRHVCVGARGGFARFHVPYSGEISGMTLYHRNGQVYHCGAGGKHCYGKFGGAGNLMGIIVTRSNNHRMYPARGTPGFHGLNRLGFYRMNGHNRMSDTLSFGGPSYRVRAREELRFYYAESYVRRTLGDNGGHTCFYVYLFYKRTTGNSICLNGRSGFGTMHVPRSGVVTGMELHHVWGEIYHCGPNNRACFGKFGGAHDKIGIIVTDERSRVMYPNRGTGGLVGGIDRHGFYRLNKFGRYSHKVALINPNHRVSKGQRMRFYFGEAFRRRGTSDNGGLTCFNVRLHYQGENARLDRQNSYLAHRFAPWLYFSSRAKDFPMNAQRYYQFKLRNRNAKAYVENRNIQATTTYYTVNRCGRQVRITYWWYYGYQKACVNIKLFGFKKGHHRGDWEKTHVILSWDEQHIIAVAYEQHAGQLTKLASGVRYRDGRPIIYVGDLAHGSYADDKIRSYHKTHKCQYFGDHRTPNGRTKFDSQRKLIPIKPYEAGSQTWQKDLGFCKSYQCQVSTTPHEYEMFHGAGYKKFCVGYKACDEAGCEETECLPGRHRQQVPVLGTRPRCCKKCGWWKFKVPCKCQKRNWVIPHHNFARGHRVPPYQPLIQTNNRQVCRRIGGVDAPGNDLVSMRSHSPSDCESKCRAHGQCSCWTYNKHVKHCWLKRTCGAFRRKWSDTSGTCLTKCTRHSQVDCWGNDLARTRKQNVRQCEDWCLADGRCKCYAYNKSNKWCWKKSACPKNRLVRRRGAEAYVTGTCFRKRLCNRHLAKDAPGHDLRSFRVNNVEECETECTRSGRCKCYTFNAAVRHCWLKSRCGRFVNKLSDTSGSCP